MPDYDDRTALIVVDVQNDFADAKGSLYVPGGDLVVAVANREIAAARKAGALVVYSQDWHPQQTPHFATAGGIWPVHCVAGTWGADFAPGLLVDGETIRKGTGGEDGYSAFTVRDSATGVPRQTPLDSLLRSHAIERVVIVGLATDYCVKDTALDARSRGYQVTVLLDGVRPVDLHPGDGARALEAIQSAGGSVA